MFMYGFNSCRGPPFLVPVDKVSQIHIDRFLDLMPYDQEGDIFGFYEYLDKYSVKPIPSEFGKSQIIKEMIFGIEQESGGLIIESNGKCNTIKP